MKKIAFVFILFVILAAFVLVIAGKAASEYRYYIPAAYEPPTVEVYPCQGTYSLDQMASIVVYSDTASQIYLHSAESWEQYHGECIEGKCVLLVSFAYPRTFDGMTIHVIGGRDAIAAGHWEFGK